jgi:seryl-tRNA synthetase
MSSTPIITCSVCGATFQGSHVCKTETPHPQPTTGWTAHKAWLIASRERDSFAERALNAEHALNGANDRASAAELSLRQIDEAYQAVVAERAEDKKRIAELERQNSEGLKDAVRGFASEKYVERIAELSARVKALEAALKGIAANELECCTCYPEAASRALKGGAGDLASQKPPAE